MKQDVKPVSPAVIAPYEVTQAIVGMEMTDRDDTLLSYLNFFSQRASFAATYFVHVIPDFSFASIMLDRVASSTIENYSLNEEMVQVMEQRVSKRMTFKDDIYVEYDLLEGEPLDELLHISDNLKADLMVVGQKSGSGHHGILAKNLVRKSHGDALLVPEKSERSMKNILVPLDFSEHSARALKRAIALNKGQEEKARIHCLHVYSMPDASFFRIDRPWSEVQQMMEKRIREGFEAFISDIAEEDKANLEFTLIHKDVPGMASYIFDFAKNHEIDFVVLGAKGHSKIQLLLMGSVCEKFISMNDRIPTMIIK